MSHSIDEEQREQFVELRDDHLPMLIQQVDDAVEFIRTGKVPKGLLPLGMVRNRLLFIKIEYFGARDTVDEMGKGRKK